MDCADRLGDRRIGDEHAGSDHIFEAGTTAGECLFNDLEAAPRLNTRIVGT
jgi:hypothetical protein